MIIPSVIASSQSEFEERLAKVAFLDCVHIDVMDGKFVTQKSFQFDVDYTVLHNFAYVEVHLMVAQPLLYLEKHRDLFLKATKIIVHCECNIEDVVALTREYHKLISIAINPSTPYTTVLNVARLYAIPEILVMTVNPGKYGSPFLPQMLSRISQLATECTIECDGSMNELTIQKAVSRGASHFVVGSVLQNATDVNAQSRALIAASQSQESPQELAEHTI